MAPHYVSSFVPLSSVMRPRPGGSWFSWERSRLSSESPYSSFCINSVVLLIVFNLFKIRKTQHIHGKVHKTKQSRELS